MTQNSCASLLHGHGLPEDRRAVMAGWTSTLRRQSLATERDDHSHWVGRWRAREDESSDDDGWAWMRRRASMGSHQGRQSVES